MSRSFKRVGSALSALSLVLIGLVAVQPAQADEVPSEGISTDAAEIALGEELAISYQTDSPDDTNWIGIYAEGTTPGPATESSMWRYAPGAEGTVVWQNEVDDDWTEYIAVTPGEYEIYLLAEDGHEPLGAPVPLTVVDDAPANSVTTDAKAITLGEELAISYQTDSPDDTNWIAIYPEGETPSSDSDSTMWRYAPGAEGTVVWQNEVDDDWAENRAVTPGEYEIYLLAEDGYEPLGDPAPLTVADGASTNGVATDADTITLGEELAISYQTDSPDDTNWIGIYPEGDAPGGGPLSTVWQYAEKAQGTMVWNSGTNEGWKTNASVAPGEYEIYLFAEDGYESIGDSVKLTVKKPASTHDLILSSTEVVEGEELKISYNGGLNKPLELGIFTRPQTAPGTVNVPDLRLPLETSSGTATWDSGSDSSWQRDGAPLASGDYQVGLFEPGDYSKPLTDYESFAFEAAVEPDEPADPVELSVLSINIWLQGTSIPNGIAEIADVIRETEADIIFLPEGGDGIAKVARDLDYNYYDYRGTNPYESTIDAGVISKYPIIDAGSLEGNGWHKAVVDVNGYEVAAYGGHLEYRYYVNYLPRGYGGGTPPPWETSEYGWSKLPEPNTDIDLILEINEASGRPEQGDILVADAQQERDKGRLVIAGGDLNEASHQDWGEDTKDLLDHNGTVIPWQTTSNIVAGGFVDAYREAHPDPVTHPGITWPSDNPLAETTELTWAPDADERDRIDYIFFMPDERLKLRDAVVVGPKNSIVRNERVPDDSEDVIFEPEAQWPSDHKAVLTEFTLGDTPVEPEPTPDPTEDPDPEPEPTENPGADSGAEDNPDTDTDSSESSASGVDSDGELAKTGTSTAPWMLIVAGLLTVGGVLTYSRRKTA